MLISLHIENYALIEQSDISFDKGFVAITGETGAGKSIMLGALALLLGGRADSGVLYNHDRKCIVEAQFNVAQLDLQNLFSEADVDYNNDGIIIIRREILPSAKSRAFVNDTPVPLPFLKQLAPAIIDIHSQHANLLLAENGFQISLLDSIGNNASDLDKYKKCYRQYTDLKHQLELLTTQEQQNRRDYDYNKFLFDELQQANLADGEQEELEQESSLLNNAESIKESLVQMVQICDADDESALARLNVCKSQLSKIAHFNPSLASLAERLESSLIELRDIVSTAESLNDDISYSPERQQQVDDRLDLIYRLQQKHGVDSIAALLQIQQDLDKKLSNIDLTDQQIHEIMEAVDRTFGQLQKLADILTSRRTKAAEKLMGDISPLLDDLGMHNATLNARVDSTPNYGPTGNNSVSLLFNANKGGELRELSKVASGGEMSRLMLAIKALTARASLLPTIIFDEIDTGISGDISVKVGDIMHRMSDNMQVIAITHLPQIAARAAQHLKVYKDETSGRTLSKIRLLNDEDRRHEIAVMLSSDPPSQAALQTATELMSRQ